MRGPRRDVMADFVGMKKPKQPAENPNAENTLGVELTMFESEKDKHILGGRDQASSSSTPTSSSTPFDRTSTARRTTSWWWVG